MHRSVIAILGILICSLGGCDRHTDRNVTTSDVVGTWRMTPRCLEMLRKDGYAPVVGDTYTVTFVANGTLKFASVLPDFKGGGKYITYVGTWTLEHNVPVDNEIKRANCLEVDWGRRETASFAYENGKLILWTWYCDPDEGKNIDYVRE